MPSPLRFGAAHPMLQRMAAADSALDVDEIARARSLLSAPAKVERIWPVLAAAAFFAVSALAFVTAMVMAPPVSSEHTARSVSD